MRMRTERIGYDPDEVLERAMTSDAKSARAFEAMPLNRDDHKNH
jgi:hypothetical protein